MGTIEYRSLFGSYSLTVDDTVFAMVSDGELYLRACEQSAQYCVKPVSYTHLDVYKRQLYGCTVHPVTTKINPIFGKSLANFVVGDGKT